MFSAEHCRRSRAFVPKTSPSINWSNRATREHVKEVVLAVNATVEGQTTAHYIIERLKGLDIATSRLAHGVPVGGELDYLDEGTLTQAMRARRPF